MMNCKQQHDLPIFFSKSYKQATLNYLESFLTYLVELNLRRVMKGVFSQLPVFKRLVANHILCVL